MLIVCLVVGAAAGWLPPTLAYRRMKKTMKGMQQRQARIEAELNSLRNLPITAAGHNEQSGTEAGEAG